MRYLDWDLLMFSNKRGEDKTPFQEFRTTCFGTTQTAYNGETQPLAVVTAFITSRPPGMPFRVSVYPWETPLLSTLAQKECNAGRKIAFRLMLEIDGVIVANNVTGYIGRWPQIMNWNENMFTTTEEKDATPKAEKLTLETAKASMDSRNWFEGHEHKGLLFPAYEYRPASLYRDGLTELEPQGRIKLTISEGYLENNDYNKFCRIQDVVVFSIFHAPTGILEENNISWPSPHLWNVAPPFHLGLTRNTARTPPELFGDYIDMSTPSPDRTDGRALHIFSRDSTPVSNDLPQATELPSMDDFKVGTSVPSTPSPNKRKTRSGTVVAEESPTKKPRAIAEKPRRTSMRVLAQKAVMV